MSTAATGSLPERMPEIAAAGSEARETAEENRPRAAALIITALEEMDATAAALAEVLVLTVEIAASRAAALRLLQRRAYAVIVLDQTLAEADSEGADLVWQYAGLAIPLQINFALAGSARLEREIRAAMARRQREQQLAALAAAAEMDAALKNAVTGFLLESRLALEEKDLPPGIERRLRTLAGIADRMRERLSRGELVGGGATLESPTNTQVPLRTARR